MTRSQHYTWMHSPSTVSSPHSHLVAYTVRLSRLEAEMFDPMQMRDGTQNPSANSFRGNVPVVNGAVTSPSKQNKTQPVLMARQYLDQAENILLMSNPSGAVCVKVADFGSAIYSSAWHPPLVGTMHYRAPEAVLQAGWSYPLDVWAIACLICEIYTGQYLFELAHDDVHMWMMDKVVGPCPQELLKLGYSNRNQYNASLLQRGALGQIQLAPCRKEGQQMVRSMKPLSEIIKDQALLHPFFDLEDDEDVPEISSVQLDERSIQQATQPGLNIVASQELTYSSLQSSCYIKLTMPGQNLTVVP
eukprot:768161-Hanusia_phi.AAC.4